MRVEENLSPTNNRVPYYFLFGWCGEDGWGQENWERELESVEGGYLWGKLEIWDSRSSWESTGVTLAGASGNGGYGVWNNTSRD